MSWPEAVLGCVVAVVGIGGVAWMVVTAIKSETPPRRAVTVPPALWKVTTTYPERSQVEAARLLITLLEEDGEEVPEALRRVAKS